jgi:NADPH:quinone reductase
MSADQIPATTPVVRVHECGGPEALRLETLPLAAPDAGEVLLQHTAIGINFLDTYHRSGSYPQPLPLAIGAEAAGVVRRVGAGVTHLAPGDRVAYVTLPPGAYAGWRVLPADRVVKIPADMLDEVAAGAMLKGLTAWYLLHRSYRVQAGDPILVYAAAGATGSLVAQWGRHLGAKVIGVVGSAAKQDLAESNGCHATVLTGDPQFVQKVKELSGGGVAVAYDSVGKDTFVQSLDSLRRHGSMVSYGNASGPLAPFAPGELARRGSLHFTRPSLFDFISSRADLETGVAALFAVMAKGGLRIDVRQRYPLAEASRAHRELESRATTGASVLLP